MTAVDNIVIAGLLIFIGVMAVLAMIVEEQQEAHILLTKLIEETDVPAED